MEEKPKKKVKGDRLDNFDYQIIQYVTKGAKSRRRKVGVLFAGVLKDDPKRVAVGFSLCNDGKDKYDKAPKKCGCFIDKDGLGIRMAKGNALRWVDKTFVYSSDSSDPPPFDAFVKVPASLLHTKSKKKKPIFLQFVERVKSFYVNPEFAAKEEKPELIRTLPPWITCDWEKMIQECGCGCEKINFEIEGTNAPDHSEDSPT
jgi:hypothetical protein